MTNERKKRKLACRRVYGHPSSTYSVDYYVRKYTLALRALVFVDFDEIIGSFILLVSSEHFPPCLNDLYTYFFNTYLDIGSRFPPEVWHSHNINDVNIPRTNNAIEGWHNTFAYTFGTSKHSLYLLISKLKDEEDAIRIRAYQQDELGTTFERKLRYINRENALYQYINTTRGNHSGLEFIFEVSNILNS